jgi:hypothetical protein
VTLDRLAGVYDLVEHYNFEFVRGVEQLSTMTPAMGGESNLRNYSPTTLIQESCFDVQGFPDVTLVHGNRDATVPFQESKDLDLLFNSRGCSSRMIELDKCDHFRIVFGNQVSSFFSHPLSQMCFPDHPVLGAPKS